MHLFVEFITNGEFESECKIINMHNIWIYIYAHTVYIKCSLKIRYTLNQNNISFTISHLQVNSIKVDENIILCVILFAQRLLIACRCCENIIKQH